MGLPSDPLLVAIDDTDSLESELGTGRLARTLGEHLESRQPALTGSGCVRQQLLVHPDVPYTTHNSAAVLLFAVDGAVDVPDILADTTDFLAEMAADGSNPGIAIAWRDAVPDAVREFGLTATESVLQKTDATALDAESVLTADLGATGHGLIGAMAGLGLTATGDSGRFIAYGPIREFSETVAVETLAEHDIRAVDVATGDQVTTGTVETGGWVRPELRGYRPVLPVESGADGVWTPANR